jgi:hypothetical protein
MKKVWTVLFVLAVAAPAAAQRGTVDPAQDPEAARVIREKLSSAYAAVVEQKIVGEVRARTAVEGRVIPNAPYSAEAVTESTQVLADGNRINRKSVTRVYRDGEGRTRREELNDSGTVVSVSIVDPVAHVTYVLNPSSRTAYRDGIRIAMPGGFGTGAEGMRGRRPEGAAGATTEAQTKEKIEAVARMREIPPPPPPAPPATQVVADKIAVERTAAGSTSREELGTQNIEGVPATGSRTTTTIPAGAIGNLQPIKAVVEQWFSSDLGVLVMTKHSDPRVGETIYRLQSIVRAEPDRSLFTLPPDYTLKESGIRPDMK